MADRNPKGQFIVVMIFLIILAGMSLFIISLNSQKQDISQELSGAKQMLQRVFEEKERIIQEKEKLEEHTEKLQADSVSFLNLNMRLEEQQKKTQTELDAAKKSLAEKEKEIERYVEEITKMKEAAENKPVQITAGTKEEKKKLEEQLKNLEMEYKELKDAADEEKGIYHYNLAVAYSRANMFDEAIEEYEKSLKYDDTNADAHYNAGLLYEKVKIDPAKAILHYKKYLELKPDAEDKKEVKKWIRKLE